jgi:hypothetical protein
VWGAGHEVLHRSHVPIIRMRGDGMSTFKVTIDTSNAAFEEPEHEVARLLRVLATTIEEGGLGNAITMFDINGNKVGQATHK